MRPIRRTLLIGGGGVVGTELSRQLASDGNVEVTRVGRRAREGVLGWDITKEPIPDGLDRAWDCVVLNAANTKWDVSEEVAERDNVAPVRRLRPLFERAAHTIYVSTLFAATECSGSARNRYEQSKAQAEMLIAGLEVPTTVIRPPLIIGRSTDGGVDRESGMFTLLSAYTGGMVPMVVLDQAARMEVAPVDFVAGVITNAIGTGPPATAEAINIASGSNALLAGDFVRTICDSLNEWRGERGIGPLDYPDESSFEQWERLYRPFFVSVGTDRQLKVVRLLEQFMHYFRSRHFPSPDRTVAGPAEVIEVSVRSWADRHPRRAARQYSERFWSRASTLPSPPRGAPVGMARGSGREVSG